MNTGSRAVGIDPGTVSFDVCGLEGNEVFLDQSIPTADIASDPQVLIELLQSTGPIDMIVGPSGYGLPWVSAQDLRPQDVDLAILGQKRGDGHGSEPSPKGHTTIVGGMGRLLLLLQKSGLPVIFAPAVIHLPTVPPHRKANRIDMGTADKLCAVALGIHDQARQLDIAYEETSFIYVELGGAFTAVIAVKGGEVIDGLGGTSGSLGYRALGAMDGELAYLLGDFQKGLLCSGGVSHIAGRPNLPPEDLLGLAQTDAKCREAWDALFESLVKCVAAEMTVVSSPREILISGRLARIPQVQEALTERLCTFAPVRQVEGFARVAKEAAQGAALIAEGLLGGVHKNLVETMKLREASGTVLDYLYIDGAQAVQETYVDGWRDAMRDP
jgi:predicted butyrate kinase (DUF1464 family)